MPQRRFAWVILVLATTPALAGPPSDLPLDRGYYVSADTPCAEASNATIQLVGRATFNWPQQACAIADVALDTGTLYNVALDCEATADFPAERLNVILDVPDPQHYALSFEGEAGAPMQYCAQAALPDPWRTNDISAVAP